MLDQLDFITFFTITITIITIFRCFTYVLLIGPLAQSLLNPLSNLSMPLGIAVGAFTLSGLLNLKTIQPNNSYQT